MRSPDPDADAFSAWHLESKLVGPRTNGCNAHVVPIALLLQFSNHSIHLVVRVGEVGVVHVSKPVEASKGAKVESDVGVVVELWQWRVLRTGLEQPGSQVSVPRQWVSVRHLQSTSIINQMGSRLPHHLRLRCRPCRLLLHHLHRLQHHRHLPRHHLRHHSAHSRC